MAAILIKHPLSHLESFIVQAILPTTPPITSKHTGSAIIILALLDRRSLLALRLVSRSFRTWVEKLRPPLLSALRIAFPLPDNLTLISRSTLYSLALGCRYLTVHLPDPPSRIHLTKATLPPLPCLEHLSIHSPTNGSHTFQSLLALRVALQATPLPQLTHLTLYHISIQAILALRSGPFSSFSGKGSIPLWRNLRFVSLSILPWWINPDAGASTNASEDPSKKPFSHADKTAFKILHDFLSSFSTNHLDHLRFEWLGLDEGPNPFLLDIWAAEHGATGWFSAPGIQWRMVKSVRVKGVEIEDEGVKEMKNRLGGLRKLEVETSWGQEAVEGGLVGADKGEWVVDVLAAVEGDGVVENKEGKERERRGSAVAASPGGSFETDWDDGSTDLGIGIGL